MTVQKVRYRLAIKQKVLAVDRKRIEDVLHKNIREAIIVFSGRDILYLIPHLHRLEAACHVLSDTLVQRRLVEQRPLTRQGRKRKSRYRRRRASVVE